MKILVVDDSMTMRRIVRRSLAQAGYDDHCVTEAENGRVALEKIALELPDLILADWNMPEMTGIALLRYLREQAMAIPFGFITSEGTEQMRQEAIEAGALFFLTKPFTPQDMAGALAEHVK